MDQKQCKTGAFIWNLDKHLINNLYLDISIQDYCEISYVNWSNMTFPVLTRGAAGVFSVTNYVSWYASFDLRGISPYPDDVSQDTFSP